MEFGKVIAKYLEITDKKERSIIFNAKVKEALSKGITNKAVVDDKINPPLEPTVTTLPKTKEDFKIPEDPKEPKEPEVKPEDPKRTEGARSETGRSERTEGARSETGRSERTEGARSETRRSERNRRSQK